jgi:hypothetical protein
MNAYAGNKFSTNKEVIAQSRKTEFGVQNQYGGEIRELTIDDTHSVRMT